jgi:predicted ester cyclase
MISAEWRMHIGLGVASIPCGREGMRKLFASFGKIEQVWTIEDIIAEGEKVVVCATNNCMQEIFLGVPSYGRPQTFTATFIHHIVDGKIIETWRNADDLGRVLQLGAEIVPSQN